MSNLEAPRTSRPAPANPLLPGIGLTDPHVRIFRERVYLYASHDFGPSKDGHRMDDWWIWSSDDLFHWRLEGFVRPEETYLRGPLRSCWAVDAEERNGNYFFYFSAGPEETGVLVGESPAGPWRDPIGKPQQVRTRAPCH
jgi:arabinoxylan arabinofuranohydrolase